MSDDIPIQSNVPCIRCEYNLRGLCPGRICPECGVPILDSLQNAAGLLVPKRDLFAHLRSYEPLARKIGYSAIALMFVADAVASTRAYLTLEAWLTGTEPPVHIGGADLCRCVGQIATDTLGEKARGTFEAWRIYRSEDLGKLVFALVGAGLLGASGEDSINDFRGKFTLDDLFPRA